ncbi:MAG: AAA family ATPase [Ottowia sp.]|nr:AAA family ATPase [Ottowia sp.]
MKDNLIALSANLHKYSLATHSELAQKTPKAATTNRSHHITATTNTPSGGNFISRICAFFHRPNRLGRVVRKFSLRSMIGKIRQVFTPHTTVHTHRFTKQETCPLKSQNKHVDQPSSYSPHVNQFNCIKTPSVHFDQHTSLATPSARSNQPKYLKTPGSGPEQPSYFRSPLGFEYDRILLNRYPHYDESEAIKRLDKEALAHFGITLEALFKYTSFTSNDFYGTRLVWKYPVNGVLPDFGTALPSTPTPASPLPASHTSEPFSSDGIPFPNPYSVPPTIPSSTEIYPRGMDKVLNELKKSLTYRIDALQRWDEQAKIDFKNAFGNTEEKSKNDMLYGLNKMLKVVNEGGNFTLMSREKEEREPGVQAYVMPHDHQHTIYLRDNFFTLPLKLSPEAYKQHTEVVSQTWIIAHELSHFSDILGSEDIRYKLGVAANKFAHHWTPNLTMQQFNADNVAYYLEFSNMENLENEHSIPTPTLDKFSVNLTDRAKAGELDPAWGRESELRQILAILSAKKYNSPVLLGGAGAGKTTTAEGLAYKLFKARTTPDKEVPEALKNVEIRELKLGKLLGQEGAEYRGIVEKSIDGLITELAASKLQGKPIILFVDELHLIVGAGAAGGKNESSLDLANLLKPALSSGAITLIGATTSAEYKKHIEKDAALARRFRPVMINEPSKDAAVSMMQNLIGKLEKMHQVDIPLETATIAVEYAKTYMKGVLPDTSAKLLEDAAINVAAQQNGLVSLSANQLREQIDKLQQKIEVRQKEVKRGNLTAVKPLEDLNTEKKTALKKLNGLQLLWEEQKALVNQIREKQQVISQLAKKHTDREKTQSDLSGLIRTLQEKQDKTEV